MFYARWLYPFAIWVRMQDRTIEKIWHPLHLSSTLFNNVTSENNCIFFPWQPYQDGKAFWAVTTKLLAKEKAENSESGTSDSDLVHANS